MYLVSSTYKEFPAQADGRIPVKETHVSVDGQEYIYEYLNSGLNPQFVLEERATIVEGILAQRAAAKQAVTGTTVLWTKYEFLSRFTSAERIGIREEAKTNPIVQDFMAMMELSGNVNPVLARPGLNYLASIGKLTPERAAILGDANG